MNNGKKMVWLIDDEPFILELYQNLFKKEYSTRVFSSARAALAALDSEAAPDAVLTDLRMPEMNGLEFVSALRTKGLQMPIAMVSGYADKAHLIQAMAKDVARYVEKPCSAEELMSVIREILEHSAKRDLALRALPDLIGKTESLESLYEIAVKRYLAAENRLFEAQLPVTSNAVEFLKLCRRQEMLEDSRREIGQRLVRLLPGAMATPASVALSAPVIDLTFKIASPKSKQAA